MKRLYVYYRKSQNAKRNSSFSPSAGKPAKAVASWKTLDPDIQIVSFEPVSREQLCKVHDPAYVSGVLDLKINNGFGNKYPEVAEALPYVAGSMVAAVLHAFKTGEWTFSPTSGAHHACYNHGGGFCTFNFLALAAVEAYEAGALKVAIIDCDMHYGDGTVDIIRKIGMHFVNHYSFGGDRTCHDVELWKSQFPAKVRNTLRDADVLLYNAGADPHVADPLGGVLTTAEMKWRDEVVLCIAHELGIPVAISLAGGYQDDIRNVLDVHDNTYKVAMQYAEKITVKDQSVSADNYATDPYQAGYRDALKRVLDLIQESSQQEWRLETSSMTAVLVDAIETEISECRRQIVG